MAIKLELKKTDRILFCGSKWWGDPDFPAEMKYPSIEVNDEGEMYEYPLTFICQINCEDIAVFDKEDLLPHEGMLYFFGAIDRYIGYDSPVENGPGEWPKGQVVVKYAKEINFETFQTCMLIGEEDEQLTESELEIVFSECPDDERVTRLLGNFDQPEGSMDKMVNILQIADEGIKLNLYMKDTDLKFRNWKRLKGYLTLE